MDKKNKINYQEAYHFCEKLQDDIYSTEIFSFSKMLAFMKKMQSSAYTGLEINEHSQFQQTWVLLEVFENTMVYLKKSCSYR